MRRLRIGSVLGIPIQLDVTFLLVIPFIAFLIGSQIERTAALLNTLWDAGIDPAALSSGVTPWLLGTIAALGLFAGVLLHELGHSVVALHFGYVIESITLWVLGGVASFTEMPENWRQELLVSIAGPFVSVLFGVGCYLAFIALPATFATGRFVLGYLALLNLILAVFNMLPGFPMDGGRVLRALLARRRSYPRATQIAAAVGKGFALFLGLLGILGLNVILVGIAFFIYIGASNEAQQQLLKSAFEGISVRDVMTPVTTLDTVSPETTVTQLLQQMFRQRHVGYPVVVDGSVVGIVTLEDVSEVSTTERTAVTVADVMETDVRTVSPDSSVIDALAVLQQNGIGRILVVDEQDELLGVLTRTDLMQAFTILTQSKPVEAGDTVSPGERPPRLRTR